MKFGWIALAAAMAFAACSDDDDPAPSEAGGLGNELEVRVSALEEARASLEGLTGALKDKQEELEARMSEAKSRLDELQSQSDGNRSQIESLQARIASLQTQTDKLDEFADSVRTRIGGLDDAISEIRKQASDNADNLEALKGQVQTANGQIQDIMKTLGMLSGFDAGTDVRKYIDDAVEKVTSSLGSYVLKTEYDEFYKAYKTFMGDYNGSVKSLLDSIAQLKQQIADIPGTGEASALAQRVQELEKGLAELQEEVKKPFDNTTDEFLDGVDGVIRTALGEGGAISDFMKNELEQLRSDYENRITALEEKVGRLEVRVGELENAKESLESLVKGLQKQVQELQQSQGGVPGQGTGVQGVIDSLKTVISDVRKQIEELNTAIGEIRSLAGQNQSDVASLKEQMQTANEQIQNVLQLAARVEALEGMLSGFDAGTDVRKYIDDAVEKATSSLGSYVLKTEYDEFYKEYKTFIGDYTGSVKSLLDSIAMLKQQIAGIPGTGDASELAQRVQELEKGLAELQEEVKKAFDYNSQEFLDGVGKVIDSALAEDGKITAALKSKLEELNKQFEQRVSALEERMESLEGKVGELDGKIAALLSRIQSLVYVPETNDGKIHIGASYIKGTSGDSIGVTETKKLRYRVSPASLRDSLVEFLLPAEYTFWQDHVTRIEEANKKVGLRKVMAAKRAEHDGLNEFNIVKVEAGTREGELLITVDNEHDFTHEDLAVALCIKHEDTESGVLTEFVSPYTVVVGKGENIASHFYAAKKEADGSYSSVSRNNVVEYTRRYNDPTPVRIMEGYELVYDDGEEVMSLEDAKAKYEWDGDLQGEFKYKNTGSAGGTLTSSDFDLNKNDSTFTLKSPGKLENVGKSWYINIDPTITKESKTAVVGPQIKVEVLILPESYEVKAEVVWNSDKWRSGVQTGLGWTSDAAAYTTAAATLTGTGGDLPGDAIRQIFEDGKKWEVEGDDSEILKDEGGLDITATTVSGHLAFIVKGFKYCNGEHTLKFKESEHNGVKVTGTIKFVGPDDSNRKVTLNDVEMKTDPQDASYSKYHSISAGYPLIFMSAAADYPDGQKLPYGDEEITKFFSGDRGKVMDWMTWAVTHKKFTLEGQETPCQKTNEDGDGPASVKLGLSERGGRPYVMMATIYVENNDSIKNLKTASTYQIPDGMKIKVEDGPEIPVSGTFKFNP